MNAEELQLLIRFGLADQDKATQAAAYLKMLEQQMADLREEAAGLKQQMDAAMQSGGNTDALNTKLETVNTEMRQLGEMADQVGEKMKNLGNGGSGEAVAQAASTFTSRFALSEISRVGMAVSNAGTAIKTTIDNSINAYLATASVYDQSANRWKAAQAEMQNSFSRIGGVAVQQLLPTIEMIAQVSKQIADLVQKYPWLVNLAIGTGTTLLLVGKVTELMAQTALLIMAVQMLSKMPFFANLAGGLGGMLGGGAAAGGEAAAGAGLGGILATLLPAAAIATIGTAIGGYLANQAGNAVNKATGQKEQSLGDVWTSGRQMLSLSAGGLGEILSGGNMQVANEWFLAMGRMTGVIQDQANAAKGFATSFAGTNVQQFIDYQKQVTAATQQYQDQVIKIEQATAQKRLQIAQTYADQVASSDANYQKQVSSLGTSFRNSQVQAEDSYNQQRAKATETFQIDMQRAEQDHQKALRQLEADHTTKIRDLVAARDALGILQENESYQKQVSDSNSQFNIETQRKKEDYQRQMADLQANFVAQRAVRAQQYHQQLNDLAAQHADEMARLQKQKDDQLTLLDQSQQDQLSKLKEGYDKQSTMMQQAFIDRLNAMSQSIQGDTAAWVNYMSQETQQFQAWLAKNGFSLTGGVNGQRASGGDVFSGLTYLVGEQGPELFKAPRDGSIVPAGLTASLLNQGRSGNSQNGRNLTMNIETSSLTMSEVINEMDKRFDRFNNLLGSAFS